MADDRVDDATVGSLVPSAAWSSGMILASGARGPGFNSQSSPLLLGMTDQAKIPWGEGKIPSGEERIPSGEEEIPSETRKIPFAIQKKLFRTVFFLVPSRSRNNTLGRRTNTQPLLDRRPDLQLLSLRPCVLSCGLVAADPFKC